MILPLIILDYLFKSNKYINFCFSLFILALSQTKLDKLSKARLQSFLSYHI